MPQPKPIACGPPSPGPPEQRVVENAPAAVQAQRVLPDGRGAASGLLVVVLEHLHAQVSVGGTALCILHPARGLDTQYSGLYVPRSDATSPALPLRFALLLAHVPYPHPACPTLDRARPLPSSRMERVSTPTMVDLPLSTLPMMATRTSSGPCGPGRCRSSTSAVQQSTAGGGARGGGGGRVTLGRGSSARLAKAACCGCKALLPVNTCGRARRVMGPTGRERQPL